MQLFDAEGRRLYVTEDERRAFVAAAKAPREVRTFCSVLHATGCRISEALALTGQQIDLSGRVVVFESLKKRRRGVYRAVPGAARTAGRPRPGARHPRGAAAWPGEGPAVAVEPGSTEWGWRFGTAQTPTSKRSVERKAVAAVRWFG